MPRKRNAPAEVISVEPAKRPRRTRLPKSEASEPTPSKVKDVKVSKETKNEGVKPKDMKKRNKSENPARIAPATKAEEERKDGEARYWLMKAEPEPRLENGVDVSFSIDDLASKKVPEPWDGIRNHVAKNNILAMRKGDLAFFYHSNCKVPGIVGIMEIVGEAIPDVTSWNPKSPYYDEKSAEDKPRWFCPLVEFRQKFDKMITLERLKKEGQGGSPVSDMQLLRLSRLSVSKVSKKEWDYVMSLVQKQS